MSRLNFAWVALALALAGCNATDGSQQAAGTADGSQQAAAEGAPLETLEPAAGDPKSEPETALAAAEPAPSETAALPAETPAVDTTAVDQAAQAYLNCVVGRAAQSASGGQPHEDAVESGVDACRNQFREARWAYQDTGATDAAADRYGVNLLSFVRNEALSFLNAPAQ